MASISGKIGTQTVARAPGTSETPLRMSLLARLKRALCPLPRHDTVQVVVMAHGVHTVTTLMMAAFHQDWKIRFPVSAGDAMAALRKAPCAAFFYDWDSREGDWRALCSASVERGVPFYLVASSPPDDLFLAVAAAGGSGVLWKPFNSRQIVEVLDSVRA